MTTFIDSRAYNPRSKNKQSPSIENNPKKFYAMYVNEDQIGIGFNDGTKSSYSSDVVMIFAAFGFLSISSYIGSLPGHSTEERLEYRKSHDIETYYLSNNDTKKNKLTVYFIIDKDIDVISRSVKLHCGRDNPLFLLTPNVKDLNLNDDNNITNDYWFCHNWDINSAYTPKNIITRMIWKYRLKRKSLTSNDIDLIKGLSLFFVLFSIPAILTFVACKFF